MGLASLPINILTKWTYFPILALLLLVGESILSTLIILKIPYTEIDWVAYMEEVEGFLDGERDYMNLKGQTGPLVYPAAFVYIYSFLRYITEGGKDIMMAQFIFLIIYITQQAILMGILYKTRICPPWVAVLLCASRRIHSIFVLRLFNDGIAMTLAYLAILLFLHRRWSIGSFIFSVAVGIKMNVLLFAPGLLLVYLRNTGLLRTIKYLAICGVTQLLLGLPFLTTFPKSYLLRAFELSRVFQHVWTVNLKFLDPITFRSPAVAILLLSLHVLLLVLFLFPLGRGSIPPFVMHKSDYLANKPIEANKRGYGLTVEDAQLHRSAKGGKGDSAAYNLYILLLANFIGVVCARTLHYQFYSWYYHALPILLWQVSSLPTLGKLVILGVIEVAFNVYPSTWWSSALLQVAHWTLLSALYFAGPRPIKTPQLRLKDE